MFLSLLVVTFIIATLASAAVARAFRRSIERILTRIIADEISAAWRRYITFALYVVGISGGVRIWDLEKYITPRPTPQGAEAKAILLTTDRWILEIYRTVISTLQSLTWILLVFFAFALIAYVIVRISEMKRMPPTDP